MKGARSEEGDERRSPEAGHAGSQSSACGGSPAGGGASSGSMKVDCVFISLDLKKEAGKKAHEKPLVFDILRERVGVPMAGFRFNTLTGGFFSLERSKCSDAVNRRTGFFFFKSSEIFPPHLCSMERK